VAARLKGLRRRWTAVEWATITGTVVAVIALVITIAAWQRPKSPDTPGAGVTAIAATTPPTPTATTTTTTTATSGPAAAAYLDSGFPAESGGANLVALPRPIRDDPGYQPHPIAITCPSNQTGDQEHVVTYAIQGRYVQFDADVHPYYPPNADARSATYVTVQMGVRETDGDLRITEAGSQKTATMSSPQPVTATIDNAEKLTVRVQCADPRGTVVLTNARLTSG
jgi:hypothetical protein